MTEIIEGKVYELNNHKSKTTQKVFFGYTDLENSHFDTIDGTTNAEVLEMMISRLQYLSKNFPCKEYTIALYKLEESLFWITKLKK
jgi:hypothetical protein